MTTIKFNLKKKKTGKSIINSNTKNRCNTFLNKAKLAIYMKNGLDIKDAAKLCNISEYQLGILRSDPEFEELINFCSVNCELIHLKNIGEAGNMGAWQASAWMLERKFPDKYSKKDTVRHEYEVKLMSFQKVILSIINDLDPQIRQIVMQKLRSVNVESEVNEINIENANLLNGN